MAEDIIPTIPESDEEYIGTIFEDVVVAGVTSLDGQTGDLTLKTVNNETILGEGNIQIDAGVTSVNGATGDVTITASGIGAATSDELGAEALARSQADDSLQTAIDGKQAQLSSAQLDAVNSGIDSTKVGQIATNAGSITTIEGKIPSAASTSNQLADKNFVNSSIQTQTAHFRGNWGTWADVPTDASLYPVDDDGNHAPTSNDYMVVQDASGYTLETLAGTWRFKYSGVWVTNGKNGWHPEYQVNETPFTSDQLAAINSGITSSDVQKLGGIAAGAEVNVQANWNETDTTDDAYIQNKPSILQATGSSTTDVMSQKAVTDLVGNVETILQTLNSGNGAA